MVCLVCFQALTKQHVIKMTINNEKICGNVLGWSSDDGDDCNPLKMCCYCWVFSEKYRRLNHLKCLRFAPLLFFCGVGRKEKQPCTGFCGIKMLLNSLANDRSDTKCMSHYFRSKKLCLDYANMTVLLCRSINLPFHRSDTFPVSMVELLLIFKTSHLFSDFYLTILSYDNNHQITTSEVDLQLHKKPIFLLVV